MDASMKLIGDMIAQGKTGEQIATTLLFNPVGGNVNPKTGVNADLEAKLMDYVKDQVTSGGYNQPYGYPR